MRSYLKNCQVYFFGLLLVCLIAGFTANAAAEPPFTLKYARGFTVEILPEGRLVTVQTPWREAAPPFQYLLVPRGGTPPGGYPRAQVIHVPVRRVAALSTTHLAYLEAAGLTEHLVALGSFKHVTSPAIRARITAGELEEVGYFSHLNIETLLELAPDLILTSASGSIYDVHPKLQEAGLPVALVLDHWENHPLGRCEWIRFLALFFDRNAHAKTLFQEIEGRYRHLTQQTEGLTQRPVVMSGTPFQGQWQVARGNSFIARYIQDAGGQYLWADIDGVGSLPMDVEAVYGRALQSDIWINTGVWKTLADAIAADPRFAGLPPVQNARIYNNNKMLNPMGGNDFWESGIIRPDVVLADLLAIFQPDLLPEHELVYYQRLPSTATP